MHGNSGNRIRLIRQQHTAIIEELLHTGAALATEGPAQSVGTAPTLEVSPPVVLRHPPLQERVRGASSQGGAATEFKGHWTRCSHQRSSTLKGTQVAERSVFSFQKTQKHVQFGFVCIVELLFSVRSEFTHNTWGCMPWVSDCQRTYGPHMGKCCFVALK